MAHKSDKSTRGVPTQGASDFFQREDGSLTIFGLFVFILMMTAGGIALDIMRSEVRRAELQYAVDRAALAAASLKQTRTPEEIVKDYIRAAGLDEDSVQVTSSTSLIGGGRRVSVSTNSETESLFMNLLGVDTLLQPISSETEETRSEVELSLVLDISGSMGGAKIETLREAASEFVVELLENRESLTTISLVPYNDRVNAGSLVSSVFDTSDEHPFSNCFVFDDAEFSRLGMGAGDELQRMGHFDFRTDYRSGNEGGLVANPNCRTDNYAAILPWSNNVEELQARIQGLEADYFTAMDLGVKWGALLLDPSSQDELTELATRPGISEEERVDADFIGRPVAYDDEETHKVLVVMTDGVNTQQWDVLQDRREGPSGVFVYRQPSALVCADYRRDRYDWRGRRLDGLTSREAEHCDGWDDAGRPAPFEVPSSAPLLDVELDPLAGLLGLGDDDDDDNFENCGNGSNSGNNGNCGGLDASVGLGGETLLSVSLFGGDVPINRFGANGAGCAFGSDEQQALCRAQFDDSEGYRYLSRYSVWSDDVNAYYISDRRQYWRNHPFGGDAAIELDWSEILGSIGTSYLANTVMSGATWNDRVDYFYSFETTHRQSRADTNLSNICRTARENGVVVYTIAFQAPDDGRAAMLDCAGGQDNATRFFDVDDLDIEEAFDDVIASVGRLRLTK